MGLRDTWKAAKVKAKRMNNGRDVNIDKAVPGWAMGPRLDAWEKAAEALESARHTDGEAAARADAQSAQRAVQQTFAAYQAWLDSNPVALREVSQGARHELIGAIGNLTAVVLNESRRLGVVPVARPGAVHHPRLDPPDDPPDDPDDDADPDSDPDADPDQDPDAGHDLDHEHGHRR